MFPIIYSPQYLNHDTGRFHPEKPGRLTAIVEALQAAPWADRLVWQAPTGDTSEVMFPQENRLKLEERLLPLIHTLHEPDYVSALKRLADHGGGRVDPDTPVSEHSYDIALLAVSGWLDGIDRVWQSGEPAFVLARPPGHHALRNTGMGFCLLSNAAIAAHYALQQLPLQRVAILDWDVHHGNGTQALVESHPNIAYCSLHQWPFYPGTGRNSDRGKYDNVLNLPIAAESTLEDYRPLFEQQVMPFFSQFRPDLLIVSAGYDAIAADPLAQVNLQPSDYSILTEYCLTLTRRILFGLEGGYDFQAIAEAVVATIASCL